MSTYLRLDLQTLGSQPVMPKNDPHLCCPLMDDLYKQNMVKRNPWVGPYLWKVCGPRVLSTVKFAKKFDPFDPRCDRRFRCAYREYPAMIYGVRSLERGICGRALYRL